MRLDPCPLSSIPVKAPFLTLPQPLRGGGFELPPSRSRALEIAAAEFALASNSGDPAPMKESSSAYQSRVHENVEFFSLFFSFFFLVLVVFVERCLKMAEFF